MGTAGPTTARTAAMRSPSPSSMALGDHGAVQVEQHAVEPARRAQVGEHALLDVLVDVLGDAARPGEAAAATEGTSVAPRRSAASIMPPRQVPVPRNVSTISPP